MYAESLPVISKSITFGAVRPPLFCIQPPLGGGGLSLPYMEVSIYSPRLLPEHRAGGAQSYRRKISCMIH